MFKRSDLITVTTKPTSELSYIPGLNGLRAIAIICVVFCHANIMLGNVFLNPGHPIAAAFTKLAGAGWIGVDLFFVLSGFLITRILFATKGQEHYFRNFYARRTLRIFPLYYAYVALVLVVLPYIGGYFGSAFWKHPLTWDRLSVLFYLYNFRVAAVGHHLPLVNQLWSLAVEEHFYLIWPLIVFFSSRKVIIRVTLIGFLFSFLCRLTVLHWYHFIIAPYVLSPCRLDGLFLGSFLGIAYSDRTDWLKVRAVVPFACGVSLSALLAIAWYQGHFYDFVGSGEYPGVRSSEQVLLVGLSMLAIFFSCILVFVLDGKSKMTRLLEHPVLKNVGVYSYGIYIYHMIVIAVGLLIIQALQRRAPLPNVGLKILLGAFDLVFSTIIAAISFKYFETPILRLKSRFPERGPS